MTFNHSAFDSGSSLTASLGCSVTTIAGLILNSLTLYVILKTKLKKHPIAPVICALAFSDLTFCLVLILVAIQFYHNEPFTEGTPLCDLSPILYR